MQVGAVFGLIFALIVMGLIIIFGTEQIVNLMCIGNVGQTSKAVKNLDNLVDDLQASGEGSTDTFRMSIPTNAKVCFLNSSDPRPSLVGKWTPDPDLYPVIEKKIQIGGYNVWIDYGCGNAEPGYIMDYITLPAPPLGATSNFCLGSGESLLLTNIGVKVRVEKLIS